MQEALDKACCSKVHRVEVIGGSTIIPVVKQIPHEVFRCEPSAALPRESFAAEGGALQQSENKHSKTWVKTFRRYLQRYQTELHHRYSEVLSNKVKTELLEKCSEADFFLDGIKTGKNRKLARIQRTSKLARIKEFRGKMKYLYKHLDELSKRKSVYEALMHETAIFKATLHKEYHIKSLQDFVQSETYGSSGEFMTILETSAEVVEVKWCETRTEEGVRFSRVIGNKEKMDVMKQLDHPNILQLYDAFVENGCCYAVSELHYCTLDTYVPQTGRCKPEDASLLHSDLTCICEALLYLKSEGIILDQLDVQNIKITKNGELKIDVLSSSPRFINSNSIKADHASEEQSTNEVNVYALGHLLHYMFMGSYPPVSRHLTLSQLERHSSSTAELIKKMLVQESCSQFTFEDVLRDPFLEGKFEDKLDLKVLKW